MPILCGLPCPHWRYPPQFFFFAIFPSAANSYFFLVFGTHHSPAPNNVPVLNGFIFEALCSASSEAPVPIIQPHLKLSCPGQFVLFSTASRDKENRPLIGAAVIVTPPVFIFAESVSISGLRQWFGPSLIGIEESWHWSFLRA